MNGLEVRKLCKSFGGLSVAANIDFDLQPSARKALIGPNGAGKSTFANLITGILSPHPARYASAAAISDACLRPAGSN